MTTALRLAVPNKGRLAEPAVELLRNAGLEFELSERRLSAAVRNADIELLFVRTEDVAEYVADGLVELGLTGADLVAEHGGALRTVLPLGFGACSLVLAVPRDAEHAATRRPGGMPDRDLLPAGDGRVPRRRGRGGTGRRGAGRRRGHATARASPTRSLTSSPSGSTLRMNGLRPIATLLASEAVLVARNGATDGDDRVGGRWSTCCAACSTPAAAST